MFPTRRISQSLSNFSPKNHFTTTVLRWEKSDSTKTEGADENEASETKSKPKLLSASEVKDEKAEAKKKLKALLADMKCSQSEEEGVPENLRERVQASPSKKSIGYASKALLKDRVKDVAKEFGGDVKKTKADLWKSLNTFTVQAEEPPKEFPNIREHPVRRPYKRQRPEQTPYFSSGPLGVFDIEKIKNAEGSQVKLKIWDTLEALHLKTFCTVPPRNHFEEHILLTERGKLWHFPIDNDQGREAEAAIDFNKHVFLDEYLEPWCPDRGPLRKFMELVLVGLSKNHCLTVEEKREHIYWYRDYFEAKKKILEELGTFETRKEIDLSKDDSSQNV